MTTSFRVALVGCGAIATVHLNAIVEGGLGEIVALCDIDETRAAALADRYAKTAAIFTDYREMLDRVEPDILHITTPHYLHCEMAEEALRRGIHVYLEKPIAMSEEEIERLLAAEKASTARICVSFQNRMIKPFLLMQRLVAEGGGAKGGRAMVTWHRGYEYYTRDNWHGTKDKEGGGVMINQAIHTLDQLLVLMNTPPISVQGDVAIYRNGAFSDVEDNAHMIVEFENGTNACFFASNNYCCDAQNFLEILTQDGSTIALMNGFVYRNGLLQEIVETGSSRATGKACWGSGHFNCINSFYRAITGKKEVPVPLASAAVPLRVLLALYRSAGKPVSLL